MNRQPPQPPSSSEQQPFGPPQWGQQAPPQQSNGGGGQPPYGQPGQQPLQPPYGQPPYGQPYWGQQPPSQPSYGGQPFGNVSQQGPYGQSFYGNSGWGQPPSQAPMNGRGSSLLQQPTSWPGPQPGQFQSLTPPPTMPPQRGRKGKTGVKIIVGVSILLVVLLVGLGGFVALRSRIAPSSKTNTSPSQPAAQVSPTATTSLAPTATPTQQATPTPTPKPTPKATPTPTPKPVTKYVTIEDTPNGSYNFAFSPATVTIPVGGIVTWTNKSQTPHNVTSTNGNTLNSGLMNTGKTFSFKFTKSGTYHYDCSIHPYMMGTVIVT